MKSLQKLLEYVYIAREKLFQGREIGCGGICPLLLVLWRCIYILYILYREVGMYIWEMLKYFENELGILLVLNCLHS